VYVHVFLPYLGEILEASLRIDVICITVLQFSYNSHLEPNYSFSRISNKSSLCYLVILLAWLPPLNSASETVTLTLVFTLSTRCVTPPPSCYSVKAKRDAHEGFASAVEKLFIVEPGKLWFHE